MYGEEEKPIVSFSSTVWKHGGGWKIPIPRGARELLSREKLYKIQIRFRDLPYTWSWNALMPEDLIRLEEARNKTFTEVSKVVKSGPKLLFPITRNTADILVPIIKSIQKSLNEVIEKATLDEALEYLLSNNKDYLQLQREYESLTDSWDFYPSKRDKQRIEELKEKLTQLRESYKPKAEELVKSGQFKASYKVELLNGWVKRPLIIEVYPFSVDNPDDAIHIFLRAPMPVNDD